MSDAVALSNTASNPLMEGVEASAIRRVNRHRTLFREVDDMKILKLGIISSVINHEPRFNLVIEDFKEENWAIMDIVFMEGRDNLNDLFEVVGWTNTINRSVTIERMIGRTCGEPYGTIPKPGDTVCIAPDAEDNPFIKAGIGVSLSGEGDGVIYFDRTLFRRK